MVDNLPLVSGAPLWVWLAPAVAAAAAVGVVVAKVEARMQAPRRPAADEPQPSEQPAAKAA